MPEKPNRVGGIKSGLLESLNSSKPNFRGISLSVKKWKQQGFKLDPRKTQKEVYLNTKFEDIINFYKSYIFDKPITITIVGNKDKIDMEQLSKFGKIIEVNKKDIFN